MVQIQIHHKDIIAPIVMPFVTEHGNTLGKLFQSNDLSKPVDHVDTLWKWESLHIMPETVRQC